MLSNETKPGMFLRFEEGYNFYDDLKISIVLPNGDSDLLVGLKVWGGHLWVTTARHAAFRPPMHYVSDLSGPGEPYTAYICAHGVAKNSKKK